MPTNTLIPTGGVLSFDGSDYHCQVIDCQVGARTPRRDELERMCGVTTNYGHIQYQMTVTFAQDWGQSGGTAGLSRYLFLNAGQNHTFVYRPTDATAPSISGTVRVFPGPMGGPAGRVATATVTMDVQGTPTIT